MAYATDDYTFGIEEEFFLVDPRTHDLVRRPPRELLQSLKRELGDCITAELLQSQIEVVSPVFHDHRQARIAMTGLRRQLAALLARDGLGLVAAGTHPLAAWHVQIGTASARYQTLIEDFRIIARRNLLCALHVHVAVPPGVDRVALMNRAVPWLPLFLGLSASSPFWGRQRTGLLSYRQAVYYEWPRTGIPDFFTDEREYGDFVDLMVRGGAMPDASHLWWAIRPSRRYPTLEMRIADSCTRLQDALALAALFRCLVRALVRDPDLGAQRSAATRRLAEENRWRAARDGIAARFIDETTAEQVPLPHVLSRLEQLCEDDIRAFDCGDALQPLREILSGGSSAQHQLAVYRQQREQGARRVDALRAVVDWLLQATLS
jgi:carboxylate-amine ligase